MLDTSTWSDGSPKSTGNAFCIPKSSAEQIAKQLSDAEAKKKRNYDRYTRKLELRGTSREEIQRRKAERVNPEASIASFIPKSVRAPR